MLTKKDITLLIVTMKEVFATKDDLKALESRMNDRFATKNDMLEFKDAILHEIVKMRDEVAIVGGQRDMLEDHELRIETVEKHLHIQPGV